MTRLVPMKSRSVAVALAAVASASAASAVRAAAFSLAPTNNVGTTQTARTFEPAASSVAVSRSRRRSSVGSGGGSSSSIATVGIGIASRLFMVPPDSGEAGSPLPFPSLKLPNVFRGGGAASKDGSGDPSPGGGAFNAPEALFARARAVLASDLGVRDPSLLADDFSWVGPNVASTGALGRDEYVAAGRFFDLRSAFPDLDYRAHDFRIDDSDPLTVRLTARTVGTMRGELRLRNEVLPPNGRRMRCPPEAISMTFDAETGKLAKLCSGMVMDRLVGNTAGLCGVMAAATVAGAPPSEWEIYPPATVVSRFFGRTVKQLEEPTSFLAPFPESVMIQLAKGVIAADLGASDPDLLSSGFTYCAPNVGPLKKRDFVKEFSTLKLKEAFPDLTTDYANFRVDPYDPYRVWADARGSGTNTGPLDGREPTLRTYNGPPEAVSFTFDDDGFCTRLTAGAVMDPSEGNTGGLGGFYGIYYAVGRPLPGFATRPLAENLARLQRRILEPITGVGVDEFVRAPPTKPKIASITKPSPSRVAPPPIPPQAPKPPAPVAKAVPPAVKLPEVKLPEVKLPEVKLPGPSKPEAAPTKKAPPPPPPPKARAPPGPAADKKSSAKPPITTEPADPVTDAFASFFGTKQATGKAPAKSSPGGGTAAAQATAAKKRAEAEEKRRAAEVKKREADEKRKAAAEAALAKKREAEERRKREAEDKRAAAEARKREQEEKKAAAAAVALAKKQEVEEKKRAAAAATQAKKGAAEAKKLEVEGKKRAVAAAAQAKRDAAEARKLEAEEKKQAAVAAAQAKKDAAEAKRREAEEKRKAAAEAAAAAKAKKEEDAERRKRAAAAEAAAKKAKPGVTISLNFFAPWAKKKVEDVGEEAPAKAKTPVRRKLARAPKGVPVLSEWKVNRDKSVTGYIEASGGSMFEDGTQITTSSIESGELEAGNVVTTGSGSKYFLS